MAPPPEPGRLRVALQSEVFHGEGAAARLAERLFEAAHAGAELVLLPELALDPWWPATDEVRDESAEEPGGPRHRLLAEAARAAGVAVVGGAIVRDGRGARRNTALVFDRSGELVASYAKTHLPDEPGFRETAHYRPGEAPPAIVTGFALPLGLQVCSDAQRPFGAELLAAKGAAAILHPRATERRTFERWRRVLVATAQTSACWVLSVGRPGGDGGEEDEIGIGGPTLVVDPLGEVVVESEERRVVVELAAEDAARAREAYPGYLARPAETYARAWAALGAGRTVR